MKCVTLGERSQGVFYWLEHEKAASEERKKATQAKPGEGKVGGGNISTTVDGTGKSRDIIGERVGVSGQSSLL